MGEIKVYGVSYSPFSNRVEIALKMKGVEYEHVEEDLENKSEELLKYNPVHKKIPVLLHHGKPIAESLVILEYIDETWKDNPLLPTDPYERAQARFWANFIDDKLAPGIRNALMGQGEEGEKAMEEVHELFKFLENELSGETFFGGTEIGFLDIVGVFLAYWLPAIQEVANKELITKEKYPAICNWADHLLGCDVIKESLPEREKLVALIRARFSASASK